MSGVVDRKFNEWTRGKNDVEARIAVFERIRDIPYAIVPEISGPETYTGIFQTGKGSCTPKHLLLCEMYRSLNLSVLYVVYPFRWDEVDLDYPPQLLKMARELPTAHHLACLVEIEGSLRTIDATIDPPLAAMGLPVNEGWDGFSDTKLAITPSGEGEIHHPSEALLMTAQRDERSLEFDRALNRWLEAFRGS
jgi:transglutaminase-like putative cysteine protease